MTPRSFWKILLKIAGLWLFVQSLPVLIQSVSGMLIGAKADAEDLVLICFFMLLSIVVSFGSFYLLIFKTDWIVTRLQLDKGFPEESFIFNMHRSSIFTIAVIILGGWMFIDSLPSLCTQVYSYFVMRNSFTGYNPGNHFDFTWITLYAIKIFLGLLMMIYCREIVNFIELRRKKSATNLFVDQTSEKPKDMDGNNEVLTYYES